MAEGYLSDLVGVHDLRDESGNILPRRNVLNVIGADVRDDPAAGETVISFRTDMTVQQVASEGNLTLTNTGADLYRVASAGIVLYGLGPPAATGKQRVWIANATSAAITLAKESSSAPATSRFRTLGNDDTVLVAQAATLLIYDGSRWRMVA